MPGITEMATTYNCPNYVGEELAEATAVEDATDDSEVTDVPDDWNMINVPRSKPVR